jgi:BirA family biotin operon repressor/biotin-[acetyl-CoA-carboxylase] ligase
MNNLDILGITEAGSTNSYLAEELGKKELPSGFILYTEIQTNGRGQGSNSWESEPYKNLIFSVLFRPTNLLARSIFTISEMVSLCVKYTLDKYIPDVSVKWPNDIYYKDKKIAGILIENSLVYTMIDYSIIGIGININQRQFLSDAPNPVSLSQITGLIYEKMDILYEFRELFAAQSERLNNGHLDSIHQDYLDVIYRKNGYHNYRDANGVFEAVIHDIEPSGHLILKRANGRLSRYAFKEVEHF